MVEEQPRASERASIITTFSNLMSFPWINSRVAGQQLKLLGAYFDVSSGTLETMIESQMHSRR